VTVRLHQAGQARGHRRVRRSNVDLSWFSETGRSSVSRARSPGPQAPSVIQWVRTAFDRTRSSSSPWATLARP